MTDYRIGIFFLSFGRDVFAGMENSLYNLALGLHQVGAAVAVFSSFLSGQDSEIDGIPVHRSRLLPEILPEGDSTVREEIRGNRKELCGEIGDFVSRYRLTHLYVCDPLWGIIQFSEAWKEIDVPMVLSLRVPNELDLLEEAERVPYLFRTATSRTLKEELETIIKFREELVVIPNSIDCDRFKPANAAPQDLRAPVIFCNCRIAPEKGLEFMILALGKIVQHYPSVRVQLCGGDYPFGDRGTYFRRIMEIAQARGVADTIELLPQLSWNIVPRFVRDASVVVLPSLKETFGRAALEALACGTPLVCTKVGNLPSLTAGVARLVEQADADSLADAVIEVLDNSKSHRDLAARGILLAQQYRNEEVAGQLLRQIEVSEEKCK